VDARLRAAALAVCLLGAGGDAAWLTVSPQGEDFTVSVPARLSRQESSSNTPVGLQRSVVHSTSHDGETFVVVRTIYAETLLERIRKEDLLEASQRRLVSDFGARVVSQQDLKVAGWPGREVELRDRAHKFASVARLFLAGNELYTVVGITRRAGFPHTGIRRFLDSFELSARTP
jgi:hypothetical protein